VRAATKRVSVFAANLTAVVDLTFDECVRAAGVHCEPP
jgi:hypothetical protein